MLWTLVTVGVIVFVIVLVGAWVARGRTRRPAAGPTVADLGTAEDVIRLDELHEQGKLSDEEYHAAKSKLLS